MVRLAAVASLLVALAWRAAADGPLSPPADYTVYSPSRRCHAFLDAKNKRTTILQPARGGSPNRLWEMPGWFRVAALSDDCEHLVTGFDGMNLLPLDFKHDLVMLSFYERGKLSRAVKLDELIRDFTKLRRTASHYYWGQYLGFGERNRLDEANRYIVETVEGQRIAFDVATGQPLSGQARVKSAGNSGYMAKKGPVVGAASIGTAWMERDGTIVLQLRAEGPGGVAGDALLHYSKNDPEYGRILRHLGGLKPGESKLVPPWPE